MSINILILASQSLPLDLVEKGRYPDCLQEIDGSSVLEHIIVNARNIKDGIFSFAFNEHHINRFHLDNIARVLVEKANVISMPKNTKGSACTALYAACALNQKLPILIISSNEIVKVNFLDVVNVFEKEGLDGGLLTFPSVHPRYSYVRLNEHQDVVEVAQQNPISRHATAGVFWYANTGLFVEAAKESIRKMSITSSQYYIAPVFNQLILKQKKVGVFPINTQDYIPLKSDEYLLG